MGDRTGDRGRQPSPGEQRLPSLTRNTTWAKVPDRTTFVTLQESTSTTTWTTRILLCVSSARSWMTLSVRALKK
jgi:hypothetical protein